MYKIKYISSLEINFYFLVDIVIGWFLFYFVVRRWSFIDVWLRVDC